MRCALAILFCAVSTGFGAGPTRTPVLLELFTSEGCSSCPPADRLLEQLDREQPFPDADLIVLSEHVDYWNHLGWSDPYSSAATTQHQRDYAARLNSSEVYTPQLVVDGKNGFVGSDANAARQAIREAAKTLKLPILIEAHRDANDANLHISIPAAPGSELFVALAADHAVSQVGAGENSGRKLTHVAVLYDLQKLGKLKATSSEQNLHLKLHGPALTRVVVFVQDPKTARILAVSEVRL